MIVAPEHAKSTLDEMGVNTQKNELRQ